jgi:pilus assembly protein Flp/PilA
MPKPCRTSVAQPPAAGKIWQDERGATAIEYALIAAMVAVVALVSLLELGDSATGLWATVGREVGAALGGG